MTAVWWFLVLLAYATAGALVVLAIGATVFAFVAPWVGILGGTAAFALYGWSVIQLAHLYARRLL